MAFCTNCGKKLKANETCNCTEKNTEKTISKIVEEKMTSDEVNDVCNNLLGILKGIFTKPIDTVKKYSTNKNFILGIIIMALNCFVCGLFTYFLSNKLFGGIVSLFIGSYRIPFFKTFFAGLIGMILFFAILVVLIFFIANTILKDKINIKGVTSLVGVVSVYTTITMFLAIILNFIAPSLALIVVIASIVIFDVLIYHGLTIKTKLNENKIVYVLMPALSAGAIIAYLVISSMIF